MDDPDDTLDLGLHLVHQLHRLQDAERLAGSHCVAFLDERRRTRLRRPVEGADHRRLDANPAVGRGLRRSRGLRLGSRFRRGAGGLGRRHGLFGAPHGDTRPLLLDGDLGDAGLLDDAHDLTDAFGPGLVDAACRERVVAAGTVADRAQERLGLLSKEREQQELLLTRGETFRLLPNRVQVDDGVAGRMTFRKQGDSPLHGRVDLPGRRAKSAVEKRAQLVDHGLVARRREHVDESLGSEDLADRSGDRRRAGFAANHGQLVEDVVEPVTRFVCAQTRIDRGHEPGGELVLGGAHGDVRGQGGHRRIPDELVDDLRRLPESRDVEAAVEIEPCERAGQTLARDSMEGERDRVDRAGDAVRAGAGGFQRGREPAACGTLAVEADREAARLGQGSDELVSTMRLEGTRRIVQQHPSGAELGQLARLLDELVGLAAPTRAVEQSGIELPVGRGDRLARLAEIRDVIQRVVQTEDVDPVLGRAGDETAGEVPADGAGADEEAPAKRHPERSLRARLERADPLPGALDPAPDGCVEHASSGDLERGEPSAVEQLREPQEIGVRHPPGERLLTEQPDGRVDQRRHGREGNSPY